MPVFEYKGLDAQGRGVSGIVDADSARMARKRLRSGGVFPTELVEGREVERREARSVSLFGGRVSAMDVALFTRQLATLVEAGLPMLESLNAMVGQVESPRLKNVVADVRERVKEGASLSDSLALHPKVFSDLYVGMVGAGEASGTLGPMLVRLAGFTERQVELSGTIRATMYYPVLMVLVGGAVLMLLMGYVVPRVTQMFTGMNRALPTPTVVLLAVSDAVRSYWWLMAGMVAGAVAAYRRWMNTESGRLRHDQLVLRVPVLGKLVKMVAISRFTRTLSTLLTGGIPLLDALAITEKVVLNRVLSDAIATARENIKEGEGIARPLAASGVFPPMVVHMVTVGEATGELEAMLVKVSEAYDREVTTTVGSLTAILSPVMILFMGAVVFAIVVAILLPIVELSGLAS
ncbi:MAG: type II secretion system inner membrane protein GspF [Nitrospirota bacterium]|nr:type II secretion system inner membrane protein GspF [Nitrospirota bacterium]